MNIGDLQYKVTAVYQFGYNHRMMITTADLVQKSANLVHKS